MQFTSPFARIKSLSHPKIVIPRPSLHRAKIDLPQPKFQAPKQFKKLPTFQLTASPLLERAITEMSNSIPDWGAIMRKMLQTDKRVETKNKDNIAGSAAEHIARMGLTDALLSNAPSSGAKILTNPIPDTVVQAGGFVFITDPITQNCSVFNAETGQLHTEFDGLFAIQHPGREKPEIIIVESKKSTPRLPKYSGVDYVNKYIEHKLIPLRALFKTDTFSFVLSICKSKELTRNQRRFMSAFKKLGGQVAQLGAQRYEVEAFALCFL